MIIDIRDKLSLEEKEQFDDMLWKRVCLKESRLYPNGFYNENEDELVPLTSDEQDQYDDAIDLISKITTSIQKQGFASVGEFHFNKRNIDFLRKRSMPYYIINDLRVYRLYLNYDHKDTFAYRVQFCPSMIQYNSIDSLKDRDWKIYQIPKNHWETKYNIGPGAGGYYPVQNLLNFLSRLDGAYYLDQRQKTIWCEKQSDLIFLKMKLHNESKHGF